VLDLFAGTGALAIEALSRGAKQAYLVEQNKNCCAIIRDNLRHTKFTENSFVYCQKASSFIKSIMKKGVKFDIVFMDPPYSKNFIQETLQLLVENGIMKNEGIVVVEHHKEDIIPHSLGTLISKRVEHYGDTNVTFLVNYID
jgi:16S rRNA (guanine966-N2)-methyltransferase